MTGNMAPQLGDRITRWRELRGLKRSELAELCGVSYNAVAHWENGRHYPPYPLLESLVEELGLTLPLFFGELPRKL